MPLPLSGSISASMINVELGRSSTAFFNINGFDERYLAASTVPGTLDTTFLSGKSGASSSSEAIASHPDGSLVVAGEFLSFNGVNRKRIAKLNTSSGDVVSGFFPNYSGETSIVDVAVQPDGKIIIGGFGGLFLRLHNNGVNDTSFTPESGFTGSNQIVFSISLNGDGTMVVGGAFTAYRFASRNFITGVLANGIINTGFNVGTGANNFVCTTAIQTDGKVIIGGEFTSYSGVTTNRIARLHPNGILDTSTFSVGSGANNTVSTSSIQPDGKIIIGGAFTNYRGTPINRIARLHTNGVLDTSFSVGTGATNNVNTIAIQTDGKVVIGGQFTSYAGFTSNRIARLAPNGLLDTGFYLGSGFNNPVFRVSFVNGKIFAGGLFTSHNGTTRNRVSSILTEFSVQNTQKLVSGSIISFNDFYGKSLASYGFGYYSSTSGSSTTPMYATLNFFTGVFSNISGNGFTSNQGDFGAPSRSAGYSLGSGFSPISFRKIPFSTNTLSQISSLSIQAFGLAGVYADTGKGYFSRGTTSSTLGSASNSDAYRANLATETLTFLGNIFDPNFFYGSVSFSNVGSSGYFGRQALSGSFTSIVKLNYSTEATTNQTTASYFARVPSGFSNSPVAGYIHSFGALSGTSTIKLTYAVDTSISISNPAEAVTQSGSFSFSNPQISGYVGVDLFINKLSYTNDTWLLASIGPNVGGITQGFSTHL
jgi:uncharacterized delta-60 repeat protein